VCEGQKHKGRENAGSLSLKVKMLRRKGGRTGSVRKAGPEELASGVGGGANRGMRRRR